MERKRVHLYISGRVQGVSFRWHTRDQAKRWSLEGWVKNLPDGRVEILAEGQEDGVKALVEWVHRGPPAAEVEDVTGGWEPATGEHKGTFEILR